MQEIAIKCKKVQLNARKCKEIRKCNKMQENTRKCKKCKKIQ